MIDTALALLIRNAIGTTNKAQVRPGTEVTNVLRDTLPVVIFTQLTTNRLYTDQGNTGVVTAVFNLDIYAGKATDARTLADTIRVGIDGYRGTTDGTQIDRIYFGRDKLLQGSLVEGANQIVARYAAEMSVVYRERTS